MTRGQSEVKSFYGIAKGRCIGIFNGRRMERTENDTCSDCANNEATNEAYENNDVFIND